MNTVTIKTSELSGAALDYVTALAVGEEPHAMEYGYLSGSYYVEVEGKNFERSQTLYGFDPSSDWSLGGPLIERYQIGLTEPDKMWDCWSASSRKFRGLIDGLTPLIAACRAIVAAELGDSVEVPEVLV